MAYNNNAPGVSNNILDDIDAIKNNLDELRKNEGSEDYPEDLVAGMTFSRYEPRDDNSADEKVVVYLRNRANDGWNKIYDEEYDIYNRIDAADNRIDAAEDDLDILNNKMVDIEDGTTKVPSAENADNADLADEAQIAFDATRVGGINFTSIASSLSDGHIVVAEGDSERLTLNRNTITDDRILVSYIVLGPNAKINYFISGNPSLNPNELYIDFVNNGESTAEVHYNILRHSPMG